MFSSNSSQVADDKLFSEDVFSSYLYTGNGGTQTITNGIDLAGKGGMVWIKSRSAATNNFLFDTSRGVNVEINSNTTDANATLANSLTAFNSNGFSISSATGIGVNAATYASWTFRKAAKFFDVVTFTGRGASVNHALGQVPGFIVLKRTDAAGEEWWAFHRSVGGYARLNTTGAFTGAAGGTPDVIGTATSTTIDFSPFTASTTSTYVAYLFAHDATSDGIIQCGSYTGNGSATGPTVTLGWEPQWVLVKNATVGYDWWMLDTMRGFTAPSANDAYLVPNSSSAEAATQDIMSPTATGFQLSTSGPMFNGSGNTYIYIAIRRGPMRIPTSGTSVFAPVSQAGGGTITTNFPVDLVFTAQNTLVGDKYSFDRLRGSVSTSSKYLITNKTDAEATVGAGFGLDNNLGYKDNGIFSASYNAIYWSFRRAPSFFDEVCYSIPSAGSVNHNLGVVPEMMILKTRNASDNWYVYHSGASGKLLRLNTTAAANTADYSSVWGSSAPTATQFSVGGWGTYFNYVWYGFASCPGVSKVGSYTGNGSSQTINCGFAAGARFVMIKRTDSTGDWYVWDTARGIVAANDPHLSLNTTAAEVTTDDSIDTDSSGFVVNQVAATNINVSSATYIYLAVA